MKKTLCTFLLFVAPVWSLYADAPERPEQSWFLSTSREVRVAQADRQNYLVVDPQTWDHAREDLADLRLYDQAGAEVPYAIVREGEQNSRTRLSATVFNLARGKQGTEFVLDIPPGANALRQYDRVTLNLSAIDFIGKAQVEGADAPSGAAWAKIGTYSIFDLSREKLGRNFELQLPPQRYRYLRIVLLAPVKPEEVKGASVADYQTRPAAWMAVGSAPMIRPIMSSNHIADAQDLPRVWTGPFSRTTLITWSEPEHVPLERIAFDISGNDNFSREIELHRFTDGKDEVITKGEISRVHLTRNGETLDCQRLAIDLGEVRGNHFGLLIYNGDDPPLPITAVRPQSVERRVFFNPANHNGLRLFYGDDKANSPVYDYAKLFQRDPAAARADLGAEEHNAAYTGRPDDRPWSDRHGWVIWVALIVAVVGLGAVALRGMKT